MTYTCLSNLGRFHQNVQQWLCSYAYALCPIPPYASFSDFVAGFPLRIFDECGQSARRR